MNRKCFFLICVLFTSAILSSCSDYKDLSNIVFVAGIGIDKSENGNFLVSIEALSMSDGDTNTKYTPEIIQDRGITVLEAINKIIRETSGDLHFTHCQIIIFSKEIAEDGVSELLNIFVKNLEFDSNAKIFIAKDKKAAEILATKPLTTKSQALEINNTLIKIEELGNSYQINVQDAFAKTLISSSTFALPALIFVAQMKGEAVAIEGVGIMKDGKLVGFLNGDETRFFLLADNATKGCIINIPYENGYFNVRLKENKSKITTSYEDNRVVINVKSNIVVSICSAEPYDFEQKKYENIIEDYIKTEIEKVLEKIKTDYNCDLIQGEEIMKKYQNAVWHSIQDKQLFAKADFNVDVSVKIINLELFSKVVE